MRVNAPGSEVAEETGGEGGRPVSRGAVGAGPWNIRVNSPGEEETGCAGGVETGTAESEPLAFIELNICVKLPGVDGAADAAALRLGTAGEPCGGVEAAEVPVVSSAPRRSGVLGAAGEILLSTSTWLNIFASSSEGREAGPDAKEVAGPEDLSDCSIRVNSPGPDGVAGGETIGATSAGIEA